MISPLQISPEIEGSGITSFPYGLGIFSPRSNR
jgi:hypothetical protein